MSGRLYILSFLITGLFICQFLISGAYGISFDLSVPGKVIYQPETSEPLAEIWRWHPIDVLSAKGVRSMADDIHGNMWFGLNRGIISYDGYDWTLYDEQEFLNYPVGVLFYSSDEHLYAGSESGLLGFDGNSWEKIFPAIDTLNIPVTCITQKENGQLLVGVQDGLLIVDDDKFTIFTVLSRVAYFSGSCPDAEIVILPDEALIQRNFGRVDEIFVEEDGLVWVFMSRNNDGKLLQFHMADTVNRVLKDFYLTTQLDGHKLSNRNQILKADDDELWLINGFYKSGILFYDGKNWKSLKLSDFFGGDELHTDIIQVSDGSIWIGALGKFYVLKDNKWEVYSAPALPVPSSRILLHEARDGQVWIAGVQGDVFRINYNLDQWVSYQALNYQLRDSHQREWFISVDDKVVVHDAGKWFAFDQRSGLIEAPSRLIATREGRLWVAGSHDGVAATAYLENNRWIKQLHPTLSWGIDPRSIFQDTHGSLWFGASVDRQENLGQISGILQLKEPDSQILEWVHHTQRDGIGQHNVYGIGQSPDGSMWAGGTNLLHYDSQRWKTLSDIEYLNEFVDIVHSGEYLWVGSRYYGLFRFDGISWKQFTKTQGLPSNTIISVFEENPEKVWVITDKDIALFDGKSWSSGLFPEVFRIPREGGEIMVASDGAIWINKSLREWKRRAFPYSITPSQAIEEFWTVRYYAGTNPPRTQIQVYTERVDQSGNTLIGWSGNDYWEDTPAHLLTYSWRLNLGKWSDFSEQTSAVITNLSSGRYVFEVKSRDLEGNIEENPAMVTFYVSPPIWKQAWFITLVISFLIIIGFYEYRVIKRNRTLSVLNAGLQEANQTLESRREKIERQKEKIQNQKDELEKKTIILEEKNAEIIKQRDQLQSMIEKVEALSNVKQRFFTNISHEFRTPLTLILGSIEKLLSTSDKSEKPAINHVYEIIQRNSKRILRLINQILEIRKIETGKVELNAQPGDLAGFTREITMLFHDLAHIQDIRLEFRSKQSSLYVYFDGDKIEKILFNLLSNAFKSTPHGGQITVSLNVQKEKGDNLIQNNSYGSISGNDEIIMLSVEDTGKGIPREELSYIFERFYQVAETTLHHRFDSSGIGLSYVKDLVENHDGIIHVDSEPDKGTVFTFSIPCERVEMKEGESTVENFHHLSAQLSENIRYELENLHLSAEIPKELKNNLQKGQCREKPENLVMVVEDEPELRNFICETLESDFTVIAALNGVDGYDKALEYQPDIILTDVMMPEMNGIELCQKLKQNLATNHIPVIMLTARTTPENKLEGYSYGADAYIEKPFNMEYLLLRINNLITARNNTREKVMRELITQPEEIIVDSEDNKMLKKIREVLEENISNSEFDVETLSQQFFLSRCHFTRKIKQITGLSPKEIIDAYRLKRAGQILRQQKISISEVAYMVGFDHPNSFSRAFRKFYKMTPTEFSSQN